MIEHALSYARRGWYVFRLSPGTKIPLAGSSGYHEATCDLTVITQWWTQMPDANIGLSLEPSGLYVLDIDLAADKPGASSLAALEAEAGGDLPCSLSQHSGRGGGHVFYSRGAHPATRHTNLIPRSLAGKITRSGLDLYGAGYILLAPSRLIGTALIGATPTATGTYTWVDPDAQPDPLPPTIASYIRSAPVPTEAPIGPIAPIGEGGRNTSLFRLAATLRDNGLETDAIEAALQATNLQRCVPPLEPSEVSLIARSAGKLLPTRDVAANAVFAEGVIDLVSSEVVVPSEFDSQLTQARSDTTALLGVRAASVPAPLFISGLDLMQVTPPATPWLIQGIATIGGTIVLGGRPKTSKTWMLVEMAVALASGTPMFGTFNTGNRRRVAYFFAEDDTPSVQNRFRATCKGRGLDPSAVMGNLYLQPRGRYVDLCKDEDIALIVASCRAIGGVDVLIMEPLRDIHSASEDSSDEMGPLFRRIRALGELCKATPCVAHHMKKPDKDGRSTGGTNLRGSSAIHGSVDSGIYLDDLEESTDGSMSVFRNSVISQVKGGRSAGSFSAVLTIEDGPNQTAISAAWAIETAQSAEKEVDEQILAIVESSDEPLTKNQIAVLVHARRQRALAQIESLVDQGKLTRSFRHPKGHQVQNPIYAIKK